VLLHPGPINLNIEIEREVAYHKRSLIMNQVKNSILVRSSLLATCMTLSSTKADRGPSKGFLKNPHLII
jgi:aspartate carbamoyltransferase catalytic subunit